MIGGPLPMQHGYVRCSTVEQNPDLQLDAMRRAGVSRVWIEHRSAAKHRPELVRMLYNLRRGDHVIVWKLDRLARSLSDLLQLLARIERAGASIQSLTEPLDTSTPIGRMFIHLLGSFAEFERSMIRERCAAGRLAAVQRGVPMGRPRSVDRERVAQLLDEGHTQRAVAAALGCDRGTISRLVNAGEVPRHGPVGSRLVR
jgi:DNA invertase Pin-like site-specific DNA recombinase